ncbi:hypothetical protein K6119_08160 [Paracrocinitomix mangrovi]|uniref:hypothetical protein n=1 Tax=Paracrocinitomix mangrovi TaxID=2862509 RepID=UPI001C8D033D|nr:hypothetical protein [Paracrocinitomix mangrovi]UKN03486.1 hypothetical protein K6119_08160 [Paracrocinitomix mangrovi]
MKTFINIVLTITLFSLCSCSSKEQKVDKLKESNKIEIHETSFGGIAGGSESDYLIIRNDEERYILCYVGEEYETKIPFTSEKDSIFNEFLNYSLDSDNPDREHVSGCFGPKDRIYNFTSGWITLTLSPDYGAHDLFDKLKKE